MISPHNPLAKPSTLTCALPDFQAITPEHIKEAVQAGMDEQRAQWEAIASNPVPATVDNTVVAVDESGQLLERGLGVLYTLSSSIGGKTYEDLEAYFAPLLAEHEHAFSLDPRMYARYRAVQQLPDLDLETRWIVDQQVRAFERNGVNLTGESLQRLRDLDGRLAVAEQDVSVRIVKQLEQTGLSGTHLDQLEGLSPAAIRAATKQDGHWFLSCLNFTTQPEQAVLTHSQVRRDLLEQSMNRGQGQSEQTDTRARILQMVTMRAERAQLLGYPDHASVVMEPETIPNADRAWKLLVDLGQAALTRVNQEATMLQELADQDLEHAGFQAADWPFYENKVRQIHLGFDADEVRPYLPLEQVIEDGVFFAAQELYGITMVERPDLRGWSEDCRVWEVHDHDDGLLGLFVGDWYVRPGKAGGAWMNEIVDANPRTGQLPVIANNANFTKPEDGQPCLLSWDDVETCFHEFGHALHGLFTKTGYTCDSGTNVPRDFVECPSQLNEMWMYHPRVLAHFARHFQTGEPMPQKLVDALTMSKTFGQGFMTLELVEAALIDQIWHRMAPDQVPTEVTDLVETETAELKKTGVFSDLVPPRYRTPYFAHAFAGGYDAGYYAYIWAETMVGGLEEWFRGPASIGGDGGLNRAAGDKLRTELLSRGNSRPPLDSFQAVCGHEADFKSILRRRGLIPADMR